MLRMHINVCMHICMCVHIYLYMCLHLYACAYLCVYMCTYLYVCTCWHVCAYLCVHSQLCMYSTCTYSCCLGIWGWSLFKRAEVTCRPKAWQVFCWLFLGFCSCSDITATHSHYMILSHMLYWPCWLFTALFYRLLCILCHKNQEKCLLAKSEILKVI